MDTKDIKGIEIVAPEGYEVDKTNSTLERIVFKKKYDKPRSWNEYACNFDALGKCYFSGIDGNLIQINGHFLSDSQKKNVYNTKEEAEAFRALMQLRQLRKAWVGDWEPNWEVNNSKYVILVIDGNIRVISNINISRCLSFPDREMAEEFMECFKDLLEQAKKLL